MKLFVQLSTDLSKALIVRSEKCEYVREMKKA
jgi:hypothetical protein